MNPGPEINGWAVAVDAIVLLAYFAGIVGIGLYAGRNNANLKEFALGGRSMPWWAVLASIIAAETSAATFLGTPAEGYKTHGFVYGQLVIGTILARVVIAYTFIEPYYRYKVQSIYEFLTVRFGPMTKNLASGIFLVTRVLGIGVRLYLGGVIMVVIWRYFFPDQEPTLALYFWGIVFVTVVTTLYTAIGGIKAVVWTDLIQASLMMGSMFFSVGLLIWMIPGGWSTITSTLSAPGDLKVFDSGWDSTVPFGEALKKLFENPYTILAAFIASTFTTMATHGTDQDMVQRMLTSTDHHKARRSLILSGFADIPIVVCFVGIGILLYVYYTKVPDPTVPAAHNEIFAHFIVHHMPVGIRGLIIAGVFATMMGSTSAALNALATSFTKDFYLPYAARTSAWFQRLKGGAEKPATPVPPYTPPGTPVLVDEARVVQVARIATVVFGALMVVVATLAAHNVMVNPDLTIIPIAVGILGYTYGALLGVFLVGMLCNNRGSDKANIVAMSLGILAVLVFCRVKFPGGFSLGAFLPDWWPAIAWPWYVLVGTLVTAGGSLLFRTPPAMMAQLKERGGSLEPLP